MYIHTAYINLFSNQGNVLETMTSVNHAWDPVVLL